MMFKEGDTVYRLDDVAPGSFKAAVIRGVNTPEGENGCVELLLEPDIRYVIGLGDFVKEWSPSPGEAVKHRTAEIDQEEAEISRRQADIAEAKRKLLSMLGTTR